MSNKQVDPKVAAAALDMLARAIHPTKSYAEVNAVINALASLEDVPATPLPKTKATATKGK